MSHTHASTHTSTWWTAQLKLEKERSGKKRRGERMRLEETRVAKRRGEEMR